MVLFKGDFLISCRLGLILRLPVSIFHPVDDGAIRYQLLASWSLAACDTIWTCSCDRTPTNSSCQYSARRCVSADGRRDGEMQRLPVRLSLYYPWITISLSGGSPSPGGRSMRRCLRESSRSRRRLHEGNIVIRRRPRKPNAGVGGCRSRASFRQRDSVLLLVV